MVPDFLCLHTTSFIFRSKKIFTAGLANPLVTSLMSGRASKKLLMEFGPEKTAGQQVKTHWITVKRVLDDGDIVISHSSLRSL